jgi:class 3 adenylate cyclase
MPNDLNTEELANNIDKTRKQVTLLFTDIVDSSRYWDQFGDVKGRMLVDQHNRLIFPLIEKYRGRTIKTIGDGIMAVFKRPENALKAAIGIQQILQKMRDADAGFLVKVRIGLHTGKAIVEQNDVFGDVVNVAKRVETFGGSNEIILSQVTAQLIDPEGNTFYQKGSFIPKGKLKPLTIYRCRWSDHKDLTAGGLKAARSRLTLNAREKGDFIAYVLLALAVMGSMYQLYGRYWLADSALLSDSLHAQLVALNTWLIVTEYPFVPPFVFVLLLSAILWLLWIRSLPYVVLKILKGIAGFGLGFLLIYTPVQFFSVSFATAQGDEISKTETLFVRVRHDSAAQRLALPLTSRSWYAFFDSEIVLPVAAAEVRNYLHKHKRQRQSAVQQPASLQATGVWDVEHVPVGAPAPFFFRFFDLCAVCLGVMGFMSGFMNFTIRLS